MTHGRLTGYIAGGNGGKLKEQSSTGHVHIYT
jgi:hypothetical protein